MNVALCLAGRPQPALEAAMLSAGHHVQHFPVRSLPNIGSMLPATDVVIVDSDSIAGPGAAQAAAELSQNTPLVLITAGSAPLAALAAALDAGVSAVALMPLPVEAAWLMLNLPLWVRWHREARSLRKSETDLLAALLSSRRISNAVGMLAERHGIPVDEAFNRLRNQARANRQRTEELAQGILSGEDTDA
jgi:AmiR/NasT family two-component response regulator